jgi:phenylacetate-CoA ligase
MAYVDAAASLAFYLREHRLPAPAFSTLMACAGTVTPEYRRLLSQTFQTDVYDKYGSRECSDMACECRHHRGLHVISPHVFLEIVDEHNRECPAGQSGRILVTVLCNHSFPMIRYEVGDLAAWTDPGPCPCGSPFPRLAALQGRQDDMLTTLDGTRLTSGFVRHFVGVSLNRQLIREWQLEQTDARRFVFRYVPIQRAGLTENLRLLEASFRTGFGDSAEIEMTEVQEIPPSASGKVRWILNSYQARLNERRD